MTDTERGGAEMSVQDSSEELPEVLQETEHILTAAHAEYEHESRLELAFEVAETIRHQELQQLWTQRASQTQVPLQMNLNHESLSVIVGHLLWVSGTFFGFADAGFEYMIRRDAVITVCTLPNSVNSGQNDVLAEQMPAIWLHALQDELVSVTWFAGKSMALTGRCVRVGADYCDLVTTSGVVTLPFTGLVAVRRSLVG